MFRNLFGKSSNKIKDVTCQVTGNKTNLDNTVSIIKINRIIISKNLQDVEIDDTNNTIHSSTHDPVQYYQEILIPSPFLPVTGRLFAQVEDEDEVESSTGIVSTEGIERFAAKTLKPIFQYLNQAVVLDIPESMFFPIISKKEKLIKQNCENWNIEFDGIRRKYMSKKILELRKDKQQFGKPGILHAGWDVAISDVSQKNLQGNGYLFKTDNQFKPVNLCSNESAVSYCKKNNVLIYYTDFLNNGKLRLLSEYTPEINKKLQNQYLYRSSNI